jgi:hypothetical protein
MIPSSGYEKAHDPSTIVPRALWIASLAAFICVVFGGFVGALWLANGAADPPRAGALHWAATNTNDWQATENDPTRLTAPLLLSPPYTIEVQMTARSTANDAYGLWLGDQTLLVSADGYVQTDMAVGWREFMHIRPQENRLYLHVASDGIWTLRINGEVAGSGQLLTNTAQAWGVIQSEVVDWQAIEVYLP